MKSFFTIFVALSLVFTAFSPEAKATANYEYKAGEYVTIDSGMSPDGAYAIAAHGEGELGYDNFHIYLMSGKTGKKIGPLEEISEWLDTAPTAYHAKWSPDSKQVSILYRRDRHELVVIVYRVANGRAYKVKGPVKATD